MKRLLSDSLTPVRGIVTIEARDASGRLVDRQQFRNTYTNLAATEHAKALAGEAATFTLSHIGLGLGGATIDDAESVTGWTQTVPTLDSTTFRQGTASLQAVAASTATIYYDLFDALVDYDASRATAIELWLRLLLRGRFDLDEPAALCIFAPDDSNFFFVSLADIETANGIAFQDGIWKLSRIPVASFNAFGTPDWAHVTGYRVRVAANGPDVGDATLNWDGVRTIEPIDTTATASQVPNEPSRKALTSLTRAGRVLTADAFWTMNEAVDQYYCAGLYAGSVLVSILPFSYLKQAGLTLHLTWQLTVNGGSA